MLCADVMQSFADHRLNVAAVYCHQGAVSKLYGTTFNVGQDIHWTLTFWEKQSSCPFTVLLDIVSPLKCFQQQTV